MARKAQGRITGDQLVECSHSSKEKTVKGCSHTSKVSRRNASRISRSEERVFRDGLTTEDDAEGEHTWRNLRLVGSVCPTYAGGKAGKGKD